jgi:hypothetical protein
MSNQFHIGTRVVLSFLIVCSVWLAAPQAFPRQSTENVQAIASTSSAVDAPAGVKVGTASQDVAPFSHIVVVRSASLMTKPACYSEPFAETTDLLQFRIALTKTASLTTSS